MRGQIIGQVFIYVLAAIVFGLILLFGYRAVHGFITRADEIEVTSFTQDLQAAVRGIGANADVQQKTMSLPKKYRTVCFLGNRTVQQRRNSCLCSDDASCSGAQGDTNLIICEIWNSGQSQNVILWPLADTQIVVSNIVLKDGYLCLPIVDGKLRLRLEGVGYGVQLSG